MLNSKLNIDKGVSSVGNDAAWLQWSFEPDAPFVKAYRTFRLLVKKGFENGWLITDARSGFIRPLCAPGEFFDAVSEKDAQYYSASDGVDWGLKGGLSCSIEITDDEIKQNWYIEHRVSSLLYELLTNSIEHGSRWCEAGVVEMRMLRSREAIFIVIDQPSGGLNSTQLDRLARVGAGAESSWSLVRDEGGQSRGHGLVNASSADSPDVNFEELPDGRFRTLILVTLEMARNRRYY